MITTLRHILPNARLRGYAIAAFNVTNLETIQASLLAAEAQRSPVILGFSESALKYGGRALLAAARAAASETDIPVVIHLDHHSDLTLIERGLKWGASSAMYDGSMLDLDINIKNSKRAVAMAKRFRASVEAEIGQIGGHEGGITGQPRLADAAEAKRFCRLTGVDAIALGLGTSHGLPVPHETVHLELLDAYYAQCQTPVVLHGASNLPPRLIRASIRHGVTKINIDTELRQSFTAAVRDYLNSYEECINPRDYLIKGREAMAKKASLLIKRFGSVNEADAIRRRR